MGWTLVWRSRSASGIARTGGLVSAPNAFCMNAFCIGGLLAAALASGCTGAETHQIQETEELSFDDVAAQLAAEEAESAEVRRP